MQCQVREVKVAKDWLFLRSPRVRLCRWELETSGQHLAHAHTQIGGGGVSAAAEPGLKAPQASTRLWAVAVYTSIPSGDAAFGGKIRIGHIPYLARRYKRTKQGSVG